MTMKASLTATVLAVILGCISTTPHARPYQPESSDQVLAKVSRSVQTRNIRILQQQLQQHGYDRQVVVQLISAYLMLGRELGDERYFSYAEGMVNRYREHLGNDEALQVLYADILQHRHAFGKALQLLDQVIVKNPFQAGARLMRATIHQVYGRYALALKDCRAMVGYANLLSVTACVARTQSMQGHLESSIRLLENSLNRFPDATTEEKRWVLDLLAEMKLRAGKSDAAARHMRQGLGLKGNNIRLRITYADYLLERKQYQQVIGLLKKYTDNPGVLLRLVIAERQLGIKSTHETLLQQRLDIQRRTGSLAHRVLLARYLLDIKQQPAQAMQVAAAAWAEQKELALRIVLVRSLLALGRQQQALALQQQMQEEGTDDRRIDLLIAAHGWSS